MKNEKSLSYSALHFIVAFILVGAFGHCPIDRVGVRRVKIDNVKRFIYKECKKYPSKKVNPEIIKGIIKAETDWKLHTWEKPNKKGAIGPMQVRNIALTEMNKQRRINRPDCKLIKFKNLANPYVNCHVGIGYYALKLEEYDGDIRKTLKHYSGNAKNYPAKVMSYAIEYFCYK